MSWTLITALAVAAWLYYAVMGGIRLYESYGFVMCAMRTEKEGGSPPHVYRLDSILAVRAILRDGLYNVLVMPLVCLDFRLNYAFRRYQYKGVNLWLFELVTERLSRYSEDKTEWRWRRWIALTTAPFLDSKDPKGWHVRKATNVTN